MNAEQTKQAREKLLRKFFANSYQDELKTVYESMRVKQQEATN